jgi:tetratricopeptide (TPR) repeat protein
LPPIGSLLARTGRLQEAAAALEQASALEPDHPDLPTALAGIYLRARAYEQAQASAELAVALAEHRGQTSLGAAHEVAVRVALARSDTESATRHAESARQADAALPLPAFVQGRMLYEEGRYEDALKAFQDAEAATTEHGRPLEELHLFLGDTLSRLDRYQEAEAQYRQELDEFPTSTRAYTSLAMLYRASNREDEAGQVIGELMEAAPTPEGYASAARLWTLLGERSRADADRTDARKRFRGDPSLALLERDR